MAKKRQENPHQLSFDFDDWLPQPLAPEPEQSPISARFALAQGLAEALIDGEELSARRLATEATDVFGGSQAEGKWLGKDAYDAMEVAVNLYLRNTEDAAWTALDAQGAAAKARSLTDLVRRLPTQTRRDEEMDEFQQFSTPPALAFVANWVANVNARDIVLEPSAGTGDLAIWSQLAGADLVLNELSERRLELLEHLFPDAALTGENAEQLHNVLPRDTVPSLIVMNPPFSATAGRIQGARKTMNGARHIEQALLRLPENGRLVAIVGEGMGPDRPTFRAWWREIQSRYSVCANIGISGREYAKYGTTFDNRLIVIDKIGPTQTPPLTADVESVADLPSLLEPIRHDRPGLHRDEQSRTEPAGREDSRGQPDSVDSTGRSGESRPDSSRPGERGHRGADDLRTPPAAGEALGPPRGGDAPDDGNRLGGAVRVRGGRGPGAGGGADHGGDRGVDQSLDTDSAPIVIAADAGPEEGTSGELTDSVFTLYRPQRLSIPGAHVHPGRLVQSAAMGAVEPPAPTYSPTLPAAVVRDGLLSLAQLETVVYAGQAHSEQLPGGERKGYFVGDGTGVGKGREISGVILDNLAQGRSKAVWISCSEGLIEDARRDFAAVGGDPDLIFAQGKIKAANTIAREQGILFTTYSTLQSGQKKQATDLDSAAGKTRLAQIVDWLGADFDGVIAFDEAHNMGNAIAMKGTRGTKKPAQQAIAGLNLQREVPDARVLYVSATGATEVSNLTFAERLGLWGEGTAFADAMAFIGQVSDGGIAAMELVARDMKALGAYSARSLSYDDVTYDRLEHRLTDLQRDIYDELAGAWQIVLENVDAALNMTGANGNAKAKSAAMSMFWGTHQRFFNQVLTAFQTPAVIDHMREQMDAGHAVVVQLVNTNEAAQERIVAAASADGTALEDLDFTPRQMLMDYVRNGFPVAAFEEVRDPDGNITWEPVKDSDGNPVFDRRAIEMRDALLDTLDVIRVPENPLDSIINSFGTEQVAEVTGRSRRFVQTRDDDGNLHVVEEKRGKNSSRRDAELFQADQKRVLIFSGAGGTGYSFHADNTAENQRRRIHYILQPGWSAQGAVQGFGRTHRTNQASAPHYVLPTTDLMAQKRFISSIARRLDQLGALTRGQRQATSQGLFTAADNLESPYARIGLQNLFLDLHRGRTPLSFAEVTKQMGLNLLDKDGTLVQGKIPEIPQFLNRLLSLKTEMQNAVFGEFEKRLVEAVEYAKQQGIFDEGLQTLRALNIAKVRDEVVYTHKSGAETRYIQLDVTNAIEYLQWEDIAETARLQEQSEGERKSLSGWFVFEHGKNKGQVCYMLDRGLRINADGVETHRGTLYGIRKGEHRYIDNANEIARGSAMRRVGGQYRQVQITRAVTAEEAEVLWNAELQAAPATLTRQESMLVGAILPIWDRVDGESTIYRLQTDEGEQLLGRRLGARGAELTLRNLGVDSGASKLSARDQLAAIQAGQKAVLANGWEIVSARVANEKRIEVCRAGAFTEAEKRILKEQGAFVERINWAERVFIPAGDDGLAVFERLTDSKPVVDLYAQRSKGEGDSSAIDQDDDALGYGVPDSASVSPRQELHAGGATAVADTASETRPAVIAIRESREMTTKKTPYYEQVATKLIEQLEAGTAPWQKPWAPGEIQLPHNPVSGVRYKGSNAMWLEMQGRGDPRWMTYKQAQSVGAYVRKGEKGTLVQYWKFRDSVLQKDELGIPRRDAEGNKLYTTVELEKPKVFSAVVFNAEQIDGLPPLEVKTPDWDTHERAEALLEASGVEIRHDQANRAFYRPSTDRIHLPNRASFSSADAYFSTALHELGHATGHSSRLGRDLAHPFGSAGYAKEELRAEIASLMLGNELGIGHDPGDHASYVASWIEVLKNDPKEILRASRDAEQIHRYVMALDKSRALPDQEAEKPSKIGQPERVLTPKKIASRGR